jgi:hypothetical protein
VCVGWKVNYESIIFIEIQQLFSNREAADAFLGCFQAEAIHTVKHDQVVDPKLHICCEFE